MNRVPAILATLSALLGAAPFIRPRTAGGETLVWLPKLLGGALSPVTGMTGALAAAAGVARRDAALVAAGLVGAGLAARLAASLPDVEQELAGLSLPGGDGPQAPYFAAEPSGCAGSVQFERNVTIGHKPESGRTLRADLWPPAAQNGLPSGLGLIYAHGSGWRVGDKDMGTRPFFRRLAGQGHLVLDIAYSLWPRSSLAGMVAEMNQAILWLKENGPTYGVNPDRIVLMGGSAGAHLALMAAYTPGHPAFRPAGVAGPDHQTSVRGVVAFYPPVDLLALEDEGREQVPAVRGLVKLVADAMLSSIFAMHNEDGGRAPFENFLVEMLGGTAEEVPETYRLLSPIYHVGPHCPPTLLIQGSDDVFQLAPSVRRLHDCLREAGVPSALLEFPHTEHGFDLLLPHISPSARAATRGVEQFLARLV